MKWTVLNFRGRPNVHLCRVTPDYKIAAYKVQTGYAYEFLRGPHNEIISRDIVTCRPGEGLAEIQARLEQRLQNRLLDDANKIKDAIRILEQSRKEAGRNA